MFVKQKSILTAVILAAFVFVCFVKSGDADIEIVELRSYNNSSTEYDYLGDPYFTFYVETNEPYGGLLWSVDGNYEDGTLGDGSSKGHYFSLTLPGSIKGNTYEIEVVAYGIGPDGNLVLPTDDTDTETYDFTVVTPEVDDGPGTNSGFQGWAEVTRHYFNGTSFVMEARAFAYNPTNTTLRAGAWFRQQKFSTDANGEAGGLVEIKRDPHIDAPLEFEEVGPGGSLSDSPDSMMVEIWHGPGGIGADERVWLDAHTHLQVQSAPTDDWEADTGVHLFTAADNPE